MKFNSQICTTEEQSKRLLALGLKRETADMSYQVKFLDPISKYLIDCTPSLLTYPPINNERFIPAWSLHRLIEMLDIWYLDLDFHNFANAYEQVISVFEERVKGGFINKNYLEEHLCGKR